jgi:hypothetical protein
MPTTDEQGIDVRDPRDVRDLRDLAFRGLAAAMPAANLEAAERCSTRLHAVLPHQDVRERNLVLVAYGGGKDSAYTLAFVRAMQLILFRRYASTFRIRVVTNRHAGMPRAVLENVDRAYRALALFDDPDCELLLVDGEVVTRFDVDSPQPADVVRRNRLDILLAGHRTSADGRPTFCNACNLSVANSFGLAAAHDGGADVFITGDSRQEQRQYSLWINRLARQLGATAATTRADRRNRNGEPSTGSGFGRLLSRVNAIGRVYFADLHGADSAQELAERRVASEVPDRLRFFSVYADTEYASGDHMDLLTGFLGFEFDDLAFSFTESDCGNPALMAHLRGLKAERVYRRDYREGLQEYVDFALGLMRSKDFPAELVERMRLRYEGPQATDRMRRSADRYARQTFWLTEEQLVCMVHSPFGDRGARLPGYLAREQPALASRVDDLHRLLAGEGEDDARLVAALTRISGLELAPLRQLYRTPVGPPDRRADVIDVVLADDPHKAVIRTRHSADGPEVTEQISGR